MVEPLAILFLILVAITPFVTLYLLAKHRKLREDFDNAQIVQSREAANFRREIAELKKQLATPITASSAPPAAGEKTGEHLMRPAPVPVKEVSVPASRVDFPSPVQVPPIAAQPPQKAPAPPAPPAAAEPTELPAAAKAPTDAKPALPAAPPKVAPPVVPTAPSSAAKPPLSPMQAPPTQPPAQRVPPAAPQREGEMPPTFAARISTPLPVSAFKVSAPKDSTPKPTLQQRLKTVSSIEETLGTNWLYKLGIIILVVGVALFGIHELGTLGRLGKAAISYFTALFLLAGGIALERRERYRLIGRGGIGGGWALLFFTTYAIYYVEAMRLFPRMSRGSRSIAP